MIRVPHQLTPFTTGNKGRLLWNDNWVTFLDSMLQLGVLYVSQVGFRLPTRITAIHIDPAVHRQKVYTLQDETQGSMALAHLCVLIVCPCLALPTLTWVSPQWSM